MNFLVQLGIGMVVNAVGQGIARSHMQNTQGQEMASLRQMQAVLNQQGAGVQRLWESTLPGRPMGDPVALESQLPRFPKDEANQFLQLRMDNLQERMSFTNQYRAELEQRREDFFTKFHYAERRPPEQPDKAEVALDRNGRPMVEDGPETLAQQQLRTQYESSRKQELVEQHQAQREDFVSNERQQLQSFLQAHQYELANPAVQAELQRLITLSQKRLLGLERDQDVEYDAVGLPTEEMRSFLVEKTDELRAMEERHEEEENNSPGSLALENYRQQATGALSEYRVEAQEMARIDSMFQRPQFNQPPQLNTILPDYLLGALGTFGIDSI